jgi:putative ABC transport system substrate-binding protein
MAVGIGRRELITALGGAAAFWPFATSAQQTAKLRTIGFLGSDAAAWSAWTAAFVGRLRELGWIDGRTIAIEYRWDERHPERDAEIAAEYVRLNVDVIVATGTAVPTLKQVTSVIPIVFAIEADPIGRGLVVSLARPGGNVTGLSLQQMDIAGKRVGLLRDTFPALRQLAIIANAGVSFAVSEMRDVKVMADALGLEAVTLEIQRAEDIPAALEAIKGRVNALYVVGDPLTTANRVSITTLALAARLPTISTLREFVAAGGLMSYGPSFPDLFRRAAELVDKILRGAKPVDIPVEQPTKFELVINLKTAKALGLSVPDKLLATADEVIE